MTTDETFSDPLARLADLPVPVLEVLDDIATDVAQMSVQQRSETWRVMLRMGRSAALVADSPADGLLADVASLLGVFTDPGWLPSHRAHRDGAV